MAKMLAFSKRRWRILGQFPRKKCWPRRMLQQDNVHCLFPLLIENLAWRIYSYGERIEMIKKMISIISFIFFVCNCCYAQIKSEADSSQIYYDLIAEENYKADYKPNVTGMIVGGSLTGVGIFLLGTGIYAISSMPNEPGSINDAAGGFLGTFCILGSIPFLGSGIPVLSYNIYQYTVRKKQASKRDEYQNALDRYKLRNNGGESSVFRIMLFPSLNVMDRGGGLVALLRF